jgi:hypothetical protein
MSGLALRLLSGSRGARLQAALPVVAVAVATMLLLLTLGAWHGFAERAERTAWRAPQAADDPTAIQAAHTEHVRDRPITVVDLATLGPEAPVPPGMDRAPAAGEVWVSPALARTLHAFPSNQLAGRFDATPAMGEGEGQRAGGRGHTGTIDASSLAHPDELLAIVGRAPDDPAMTGGRHFDGLVIAPTGIDSWSTTPDAVAQTYILLARIGVMLMVVPLLALGGSASRLVAARRNNRMALLRLVGGSVGRVVGLTAAEASALGASGALLGGLGYAAVLPLSVRVPIAGGGWFVQDIWVGPGWFVGALVAITGLVTASAVISLLPAARQPFVTARAQQPGVARAWRLVAMAAAVVVFWSSSSQGWRVVAIPLGLVLVAFAIAGPWVIKIFGLIIARTARRATSLLAGRRLAEDPRSGWRAVAGMVLAAFIAGFITIAVPGDIEDAIGSPTALRLTVPAGRADAVAEEARSRLAAAGVDGDVAIGEPPFWAPETDRAAWIAVAGGPAALDRARTALAGVVPGLVATTPVDDARRDLIMLDDVRIGSIVVLISAFLVAAVSAGVGGISRVLDQQGPLTLVRLAGAPVGVLAAARRREVIAPLALCGGGAALLGMGLAMLTFGTLGGGPDARWVVLFAGLAAAGVLAVLGADLLSRPVLQRVTANLSDRE